MGNFLWFGRGSSGDEREVGRLASRHITGRWRSLARFLSRTKFATSLKGATEIDTIAEGQEPAEFWAALGGKAAYSSGKEFETESEIEPRLFNMSNASGRFVCDEGPG